MPKRKTDNEMWSDLCKRLKHMEDEIGRGTRNRRVRVLSSSSSDERDSPARQSEKRDCTVQIQVHAEPNLEKATSCQSSTQAPPSVKDPTANTTRDTTSDAPLLPRPKSVPDAPEKIDPATDLDADVLEILGVDPSQKNKFGKNIQSNIAVRFEYIATTGLSKEDRKDLSEKHLIPENCKLVGAPALNLELKAALSEMVIKRDGVIESKQAVLASAITSLGEAITLLLSSKEKNTELFRLLMDTGRALCDCQHNDTVTRRNFIINSAKKEMKESLQNAKIDNYLFGHDLSETLKAAKAINKSGADLISTPASTPSATNKKSYNSASKNWKISNFARKEPTTDFAKDSATKNLRSSSSRGSRQPQSDCRRSQSRRR